MKIARDIWELPTHWFQLVANPVSQGIEFDMDMPIHVAFINLIPLFGFKGLEYQVETDTPGVVHSQLDRQSNLLFLFPELEKPQAQETRVVVRADRDDGEASFLSFNVRVMNHFAGESLCVSA